MGRGDRGGRRVTQPAPARRPQRSLAELCNISFGFFGIQIGFALQNANMSRIFQALGESVDNLAVLWIAAPLTGLLVQPVIGHYSDRTWSRFGRRRPFFFAGALLAEVGIERISTNMIAARAGLTPPALYRYFADKYAVLEALADDLHEHAARAHEAQPVEPPGVIVRQGCGRDLGGCHAVHAPLVAR